MGGSSEIGAQYFLQRCRPSCTNLPYGTQLRGRALEIRSVTKAIRLLQMLGEGPGGSQGVSELARASRSTKARSRACFGLSNRRALSNRTRSHNAIRWARFGRAGIQGPKAHGFSRGEPSAPGESLGKDRRMCAHGDSRGSTRFHIDQAAPARGIGIDAPIGTLAPLHCTALGKTLLAFQLPPCVRS